MLDDINGAASIKAWAILNSAGKRNLSELHKQKEELQKQRQLRPRLRQNDQPEAVKDKKNNLTVNISAETYVVDK